MAEAGASLDDKPINLETLASLLREQVDLLGWLDSEITEQTRLVDDSKGPSQRVHLVLVGTKFQHARELLAALHSALTAGLVAPVYVLSRALWETMINANIRLVRGPSEAQPDLEFEVEQIKALKSGAKPERPRGERGTSKEKLEFLASNTRNHDLVFRLERGHHYIYREASDMIHGNLRASLTGMANKIDDAAGSRAIEHAFEQPVMWSMLAVDAMIQHADQAGLLPSVLAKKSSALVGRFKEVLPPGYFDESRRRQR